MGRFACQLRPRFDVACQNSSAAAPQTTAINAGTFITVMFMSGRLPSASEIRMTPISGNGTAASIRDQSRANIRAARHPLLKKPVPISKTPEVGAGSVSLLYILALWPRRDPRATSMLKLAFAAFLLLIATLFD
jgi:hypothetical protein